MTTTVRRPSPRAASRPAGSPVLDRAIDAAEARKAAELALLRAAIEWAETHPVPLQELDDHARWEHPSLYGEGVAPLAGDGAPLVAEFAPDELAVALGWSVTVARSWMGDGLELKYRLPVLFELTTRGVVPLHLARYVAERTCSLPQEAASHADRLVTRDVARLTRSTIRASVDEARLYHDPDHEIEDERAALAARKVDLWPGNTPATTDIHMTLDTPDADALDRALNRTAEALVALGDDDPLEVRRAKAVGILADPRRALDLLDRGIAPRRNTLGGAGGATLWLHLDQYQLLDLDTFPAAIRCDRLGAVSSDLLRMWLTDSTVTVRPVLDLARSGSVDQHDPPSWMSDLVRMRDPCCVFPGCRRASRSCDLDHLEPYVPMDRGGPPGQTYPDGLAPLCRRHHRAKTHTAWSYVRRPDGSYLWTAPSGRVFDVDAPRRRP